MKQLIIHTDGGARGNPGPAAIGVVIESSNPQKLVKELSECIGKATNNQAEYQAVEAALRWVEKMPGLSDCAEINFFLDANLVVQQLNGRFKVKDGQLRESMFRIKILEQQIKIPISYRYIPREQNQRADFLVNQALDTNYPHVGVCR